MDDYLAKPIDRDLLRQIVATWTTRRVPHPPAHPPGAPTDDPSPALEPGPHTFELDMLLGLFEGDRAAVVEVLGATLVSVKTDYELISAGARAQDAAAVIASAHHLKGTCADLRATRLRDIAATIEALPTAPVWTVTASLRNELRHAVDALSVDIEAQRKTLI